MSSLFSNVSPDAPTTEAARTTIQDLPLGHLARKRDGYTAFSVKISGIKKFVSVEQILHHVRLAGGYSCWPATESLIQHATRPQISEEGECVEAEQARGANQYPNGYWSIGVEGDCHAIQAWPEVAAGVESEQSGGVSLIVAHTPAEIIGQFLQSVLGVATLLFESDFKVAVYCEWMGLRHRQLVTTDVDGNIVNWLGAPSQEDSTTSGAYFEQAELVGQLPNAVKKLTAPVYSLFNSYVLSNATCEGIISEQAQRRVPEVISDVQEY